MDRYAFLFGRHRFFVAIVVVVLTSVCLFGTSRVTFDNNAERLFGSKTFDPDQFDLHIERLDRTILIVVNGPDLMTPKGVDVVRQIGLRVSKIEGVQDVYSMLSVRDRRRVGRYLLPLFPSLEASPQRFQQARRRAMSHPLLIGQFLSEDMKSSLIIVQIDDRVQGHTEFDRILRQLRPILADCTRASGLRAQVTGGPALEVEIFENLSNDITKFAGLGIALGLAISILLFRRLGAALVVGTGPLVGAIWTVGTLGLIGEPVNMLTEVVPLLVLVIGFTDSVHLVLHVRRALVAGSTALEAVQSSIRQLGLACALTSLSTAVGFGSLMLASLEGIRTFGWCCALGSVLSFLAVITVVPLLASTRLSRYVAVPDASRGSAVLASMASSVLSVILRYPRVLLVGGVGLTLTLGLLAVQLEPDHRVATMIPDSSEPYRALRHVDNTFGGIMFAYALVRWPEDRGPDSQEFYDVLEGVHEVFESNPVSTYPLSILNLVRTLPGENKSLSRRAQQLRYVPEKHLGRLLDSGRRRAVVSARLPDVGARRLRPAFAQMDRQLEQLSRRFPGFQIELTGGAVVVFRSIHLMIEDLWKSLATAAGVMFVMIWIGLRSLRYALVSVVPNVFPLLCTGAFIVLTGRHLEITSVIVFSISLGIAVDDTIHFLVHFQQEMKSQADPRAAVRRTFIVVGTALVITTLTLVAGHGIVMMSNFPSVRVFGMLTAITIAAAMLGDLLILPALLLCLRWPK